MSWQTIRRRIMIRKIAAVGVLALATTLPVPQASAQDPLAGALIGGAIGAGVGGAATGRAGGAIVGGVIGAAVGASIAHQMQPRRRGHYWYDNRCWVRRADGSYVSVPRRYC
jgi:outer membrane lipoprotein SlyB